MPPYALYIWGFEENTILKFYEELDQDKQLKEHLKS